MVGRGKKGKVSEGSERGKLKSFEFDHTIRMEVMSKKRFSTISQLNFGLKSNHVVPSIGATCW